MTEIHKKISVFTLFLITVISSFLLFNDTSAAPDQELTYHGKLTDTSNVAVPDGDYDFTIVMYDAETGGNCLWSARGDCTTPTSKTLTVTNGTFSTTLGESGDNALSSLDFSSNYYLGITIGTNSEMTPRRKITPTGFALNSHRLNGLEAKESGADAHILATNTNGDAEISGDFTVNSNDLFVDTDNGRVGIGTNSPDSKLQIGTATTGASVPTLSEAYLSLGAAYSATTASPKLKVWDNGTNWFGFGVSSGQLEYSTQVNGDHVFYGNDNEILRIDGVNGTLISSSPNTILLNTVGGAVQTIYSGTEFSSDTGDAGIFKNGSAYASYGGVGSFNIYNTEDTPIAFFQNSNTERMRIDVGGNVGIGTNDPSQKLHVNGNMRLTGAYYDANNEVGTSGQILSSTVTGTDWVDASTIGSTTFAGLADTPSSYTAGSVLFTSGSAVVQDNANFFWNDVNNRLGLGTIAPESRLHIIGSSLIQGTDGNYPVQTIASYGDEYWEGSFISSKRFRGTYQTPLAVQDGDVISNLDMWAYDGDSQERTAQIVTSIDGTVADGVVPSSMYFKTTNTSGVLNARMAIDTDGNVGIGTVTPDYKLQVDGDIVPEADDTYTLGTSSLRWQDVYIGSNSLHIGEDGDEVVLSYDTTAGTLEFSQPTTIVGSMQLTNDTGTCNTTKEGTMRYNDSTKAMEFCDGTGWGSLASGDSSSAVLPDCADGQMITYSGASSEWECANTLEANSGSYTTHTFSGLEKWTVSDDLSENSLYRVVLNTTGLSQGSVNVVVDGVTQKTVYQDDDNNSYIDIVAGDSLEIETVGEGFDIEKMDSFDVSVKETTPTDITFNTDGTKMFILGDDGNDVNEYHLSTGFDVSTAVYDSRYYIGSYESTPTGLAFSTDGTKMFIVGSDGDEVNEYHLSTGFDVSTAVYDSVFSVSAQETTPTDIAFNTDGTKMFILGDGGNDVNEYHLSTGFDVSTAVYDSAFSVTAQETAPNDIAFNTDGTKMFILGDTGNDVNKYNLSTGFDVSTAVYDSAFSVTAQENAPTGLAFNTDGTKMFVVGSTGDDVNEYHLSTGFDVLTVTSDHVPVVYDSSFSISDGDSTPQDVAFNTDGTKMFVIGTDNDSISEYHLSTGFDVSTATHDSSFSVIFQETTPTSLAFNTDGTKMFVIGTDNDSISEYHLSTGFDVSTAVYDSAFSVTAQETYPQSLAFNTDGTKMFVVGSTGDDVNEYHLSTGFDVSTAVYDSVFSVATEETYPTGITFNTDGTKMFVVGSTGDDVNEYHLSTGFDVSTAVYDSAFSVATEESNPTGLAFNTDGTKMFVVGSTGDDVNEYHLSTGFDVSVLETVFSVYAQETTPNDIAFNTDGTKMFILGDGGNDVNEYHLSTGFDVSTAVYDSVFSVATEESNPQGLAFNTDGTKMFVIGYSGDDVNEYHLSTGFDVSTAVYDSVFSVTAQETTPTDITFNTDGTKMFVIGYSGDDVNEYHLSTGFDVSTAVYDSAFSVNAQETYPQGITFNTDGTKMFVIGYSGDDVNEYHLSTGFDVSTAVYDSAFSVTAQETYPQGLAFNTDGTKMFVVGSTGDDVNEYHLTTAFSMSSPVVYETSFSVTPLQNTTLTGMTFNVDGTKMFLLDTTADTLVEYHLSTAFDVSTAVYDSTLNSIVNGTGVAFNTDGTKMFIVSATSVAEYYLSTAFVISTATYDSSFSLSAEDSYSRDIAFNTNGTKMFIVGDTGNDVNEYHLSSAFDVSTAVYDSAFSVATEESNPTGIAFNTDGTKMFVTGSSDNVNEYHLSTGFDVSTAILDSKFDISSISGVSVTDIAFSIDGSKMFVVESISETIYQYKSTTFSGSAIVGVSEGVGSVSSPSLWAQSGADLYYDGGDIGIGTASPSQSLDVAGNIELDEYLYFNNSTIDYLRHDGTTFVLSDDIIPATDNIYNLGSNTNRWQDLYLGPNSLHIGTSTTDEAVLSYDTTNNIFNIATDTTTAGDIAFNTDDLYVDTSTGNVGIGTTEPAHDLHLASNVPSVRFSDMDATTDAEAAGILEWYRGADTNRIGYIGFGSGVNENLTILNQTSSGYISMGTNNGIDFVIDSAGNVGIGTTSPSGKLDVNGSIRAEKGAPGNDNSTSGYGFESDGDTGMFVINDADEGSEGGDLAFYTDTQMRINVRNVGGIGIGTTPGGNLGVTRSSLSIGDSDTGFRQISDGNLAVYANNTRIVDVINSGVGIGTNGVPSSSYRLQVNGQPAANGYTQFTNYSDQRLKENIEVLEGGYLEKILKLNPLSFNYNVLSGYDEETRNRTINGFIAQELQEVFPEMIGHIEIDGTEYLDTNLSALPIYLTKAIQEQNSLVRINTNDLTTKATADSMDDVDNQLDVVSALLTSTRDDAGENDTLRDDILLLQAEADRVSSIQDDIALTKAQVSTFSALFTIDLMDNSDEANTHLVSIAEQISALLAVDSEKIVYVDKKNTGDLTISGIITTQTLKADSIETNRLAISDSVIEKNDEGDYINAASIGTAAICQKRTLWDGEKCIAECDGDECSDGLNVVINSAVISKDSKVFVTARNENAVDVSLTVTDVIDGECTVSLPLPDTENGYGDVIFDWFVVGGINSE